MKDFKLKEAEHVVSPRANKKLVDRTVTKIKETGDITPKEYIEVIQPNKKGNRIKDVEAELVEAKQTNSLGVPPTFFDLSLQEQAMLMFYLSSDFEHPLTHKKTHMNILHSYISAYLSDTEIKSIWEIIELRNEHGDIMGYKSKVKNSKKYAEVQSRALIKFNENPKITEVWNDLVKMTLGAEPADLLRNAIIQDALYAEQYQDKNANRKLAVDILGMGGEKAGASVNVFLDGGGKELVEALSGDKYVVKKEDLEVE